jgi:hypothetical protein
MRSDGLSKLDVSRPRQPPKRVDRAFDAPSVSIAHGVAISNIQADLDRSPEALLRLAHLLGRQVASEVARNRTGDIKPVRGDPR